MSTDDAFVSKAGLVGLVAQQFDALRDLQTIGPVVIDGVDVRPEDVRIWHEGWEVAAMRAIVHQQRTQ